MWTQTGKFFSKLTRSGAIAGLWLGVIIWSLWLIEPLEARAASNISSVSFAQVALTDITAGNVGRIEETNNLTQSTTFTSSPETADEAEASSFVCPSLEDTWSSSDDGLTDNLFETATGLVGRLLPGTTLTEPVNILLVGSDSRPGNKYGHTDTLILVTIDPLAKTAGMLSIPRDLWVSIPGYGENRINQAYRLGQIEKHPGGGFALLEDTIEANLGVPVHFHVLVDFEGFRQIIETLGGLDLCVPETIDAATYYGYPARYVDKAAYYSVVSIAAEETAETELPQDTLETTPIETETDYQFLYIEAGWHTLDGDTALRYARSRASVTADFARVQRQQAVLLAIRHKALHLGLIPRIPELWETMKQSVETDLQLADILQLARLAYEVPGDNIRTDAISFEHTLDYKTPNGARVLLPRRPEIQTLVAEIFGEANPTAPLTQTELEAISSETEPSKTAPIAQSQTVAWQQ